MLCSTSSLSQTPTVDPRHPLDTPHYYPTNQVHQESAPALESYHNDRPSFWNGCVDSLREGLHNCEDHMRHAASSMYESLTNLRPIIIHAKQKFAELEPEVHAYIQRVHQTALPILRIATASLLFTAQSTLFSVGVLTAVTAPSFMKTSVDRISATWNQQALGIRALIIGGSIIAWPICLAASAFFVGGSIGLSLQEVCQTHSFQAS